MGVLLMKSYDNHYLFSETYINEYIGGQGEKNNVNNNFQDNFSTIKSWHEPFANGEYGYEEWIEEFIDTTIIALGFKMKVLNNIRRLYTDFESDNEGTVAVCYVLPKDGNLDSKVKGNYYAYKTVKAARDNNVEWAMLTNGYRWRIYNTKNVSPYENYLEVSIEESLGKNGPDDAFNIFNLFFSANSYKKSDNGQLEIENIKDMSDKKAETIEDFLRGKADEILRSLCYGLKENMHLAKYEDSDKKNIYNDAVVFLFRLLFLGYAESRGLLPRDLNDESYKKNSFFKICEDAKNLCNSGEISKIKDEFDFWNQIDDNLRIYVDSTYDGGLFENNDRPVLSKYRISNGYLAKALADITYYKNKKNRTYTNRIEYKDLSIRNLGSIYEGLLEYNLFIADERMVMRRSKGNIKYVRASQVQLKTSDEDNIIEPGGIYLSQDATERKDTGSYYTPEDVVEYIVSNTVGKKIEELQADLDSELKEIRNDMIIESNENRKRSLQKTIDQETIKFIKDKVLSLSIIDSAMGSGHFLVNAVYEVANSIVEILCDNDWINEDIEVDIEYWKRKVVENCIYGIDINELAVQLAKLSLWLMSASNDKPLSFIDHHLKEGNSIIGTDRNHVELKNDKSIKISLFDVNYEDFIWTVLNKYEKLERVGSSTREDVGKQKEIYKEIEEDLKLVKKKYDYYLASQYFGGIGDKDKYAILMRTRDMNDFQNSDTETLMKFAEEKKFFHWGLEFPEVYQKGGFDIAIGNPPYVQAKEKDYKYSIDYTNHSQNLYSYMMEINIINLKNSGIFGFIIPISSISSIKFETLQQFIIKKCKNIYINSFAKRPCKIFPKVEQRIVILHGEKSENKNEVDIYTCGHKRWYSSERKKLFEKPDYEKCNFYGLFDGTIPKVQNNIENKIIKKLFNHKKRVKNYISRDMTDKYLIYHSTSGYWLKAFDFMPEFYSERKGNVPSSKYKMVYFYDRIDPNIFICLLNSSLFYWWWILLSDERDLTRREIDSFPFDYQTIDIEMANEFDCLKTKLMSSYIKNAMTKNVNLGDSIGLVSFNEFHPKYSKEIIDKIDRLFGEYYKFTTEETNFIINYDIRFRMGNEGEESDEL